MRLFQNCRLAPKTRYAFFTSLVVLLALVSGCVNALRPYNLPSQQKLRVQSPQPNNYTVGVAGKTNYPVGVDGRVIVDVPQLERGCATYLFGVVKVKDSCPEDIPAVHLKKHDRIVRKFSLNDIAKLPIDAEGYHLMKGN